MQVKFKYNWFGPEGHFFEKGIQIVPDRFKSALPSSAEIIGDAKYVPPAKAEAGTLMRHIDGMRAAADQEAAIMEKAEEAYQSNVKNKGRVVKG